jgi:hypothetical protein
MSMSTAATESSQNFVPMPKQPKAYEALRKKKVSFLLCNDVGLKSCKKSIIDY